MNTGLFAAAVVAATCAVASAQSVTPLSATRDIYVESFVVDSLSYSSAFDSDNAHSETLTNFNRVLDRYLQLGKQKATTHSSQVSTLTPTGYTATFVTEETVVCPSPGIAMGTATGQLRSQFRVDAPTRFTFDASLKITINGVGTTVASSVTLTGTGGPVVSLVRALPGVDTARVSGVLQPGVYTVDSGLDVSTFATPGPDLKSGRIECSVNIKFLCPADFDCSGFVDLEDHGSFVAAFEAGDPAADFDGTGFVDTDDFTTFVAAFEHAC
jgi:hypothetical protein